MIYPNNQPKYTGNVYLITGPAEMSSNESFVLMMKQYAKTKTIGMKTFGSSGNPQPINYRTELHYFFPHGRLICLMELYGRNGIKPDITLNTTPEDFKENRSNNDEIIRLTKAEK
jgi:C-terminal processing protease CtpA/Prc